MVTLKGDDSKDIISNDCNYMADLKLQVPTTELVPTAALSRFLLVLPTTSHMALPQKILDKTVVYKSHIYLAYH